MRGDYLEKWKPLFGSDGFVRLQTDGAWYVNCHYPYAITATGPGHASMLTGCGPDVHGIIGNTWYDRKSGAVVNCSESKRYQRVPPLPKDLPKDELKDEVREREAKEKKPKAEDDPEETPKPAAKPVAEAAGDAGPTPRSDLRRRPQGRDRWKGPASSVCRSRIGPPSCRSAPRPTGPTGSTTPTG